MLKPKSLEISAGVIVSRGEDKVTWDICEAGGGDMVAEIAAQDEAGRPIALLLAAAPDLYDALEDMLIHYGSMSASDMKSLSKEERRVLRAAIKALKRAEQG